MAKAKTEKKPTLQVTTTADLLRQFRAACILRGTDMTQVVNEFMAEYIKADAPRTPRPKA